MLELGVNTGKWDAGLKKAQNALHNFVEANGGLAQALDKESDKMGKFVRMMGTVDSTAKTAKGQMNDYKSTVEQLTMQYNRMTEAQKAALGKDYLQAIDQMKQKYQQVSEEVKKITDGMSGKGSVSVSGAKGIDGLAGKFGGAMQVFTGNMMTKAAMMVGDLGMEIGNAVKEGVELAKAGEGIRIAFDRLDQPGILDELNKATHGTVTNLELMKAAVKFNDFKLPLEELGTMLAFAQQKAKDTGQSVDYMVESIVTGLGRKSLMILDNLGLSAAEIKEEMEKTGDMTTAVGEIIRKQMASAGEYVETASDRAAQSQKDLKDAMEELGRTFMPLEEAGTSVWNSIKIGALDLLNNAVRPLIDALTEAGRIRSQFASQGGNTRVNRMLGRLQGIGIGANRRATYNAQLSNFDTKIGSYEQYLSDYKTWQRDNTNVGAYDRMKAFQGQSGLSIYSDVKEQLEVFKRMRAEYVQGAKIILADNPAPSPAAVVTASSGKAGGKSTTQQQTEMQANQQQINLLTQEYVRLGDQATEAAIARQTAIRSEISALKDRNAQLSLYADQASGKFLGGDIQTSGLGFSAVDRNDFSIKEGIGSGLSDETMENVKKLIDGGKNAAESWRLAGSAIQTVGTAFSAIQDPAAKVMGTIAQAVASVALAYADTLAKDKASKSNVFAFIAAAAAATASMITTIASIHSATGFAEGGIVKGNSYSGDNMRGSDFGINAGELILNRAQQGNLAGALQNEARMQVVGKLSGEDIFFSADRYSRRSGRGEIVTW